MPLIDETTGARANMNGEILQIFCPACNRTHDIRVAGMGAAWSFTGDLMEPSIRPDVTINKAGKNHDSGQPICHFDIVGGQIEYREDSTHAMAGQKFFLPFFHENANGEG